MEHPPRNIVIDWLNTIWSTDLPSSAKLVACNLRRYMTGKKEMAYPGVKTIAGECGLSDRTVQKMLKILCDEGWLVSNGQSHLMTTIYACSIPPEINSPPKICAQTPEMVSDKKVIKNKVKPTRGRQISDDFEVTAEMVSWAEANGLSHINLLKETDKFIDYNKGKGNVQKDWKATWRNWIRNADKYSKERAGKSNSRAAIAAAIRGH